MSRALVVVLILLGGFVAMVSTAALIRGIDEARLASSGPRRDLAPERLPSAPPGLVGTFGCLRHDLAVAVDTDGTVFPLGTRSSEEAEVFTPLAARNDCDEERPPRQIFALIESRDARDNTLGRVYKARVAPPPVPALVTGVIGFGVGHTKLYKAARAYFAAHQLNIATAPLLLKGKRPGVRWVAIATAAAGAHGYLLIGIGLLWVIRRQRRARRLAAAQSHFSAEEIAFLDQD